MVTSADVNNAMRRLLYPTLRDVGFTKLRRRNAWRYLDDCIWVFNIRSVGSHFSGVTGFPPQSLTAWLGIYYLDFHSVNNLAAALVPKVDKDGQLIPRESECHVQYPLQVIEDQTAIRTTVGSAIERRRDDIWWIDPEGNNVEDAIVDLNRSVVEFGIPLLEKPYNTRAVQFERRGFANPKTK